MIPLALLALQFRPTLLASYAALDAAMHGGSLSEAARHVTDGAQIVAADGQISRWREVTRLPPPPGTEWSMQRDAMSVMRVEQTRATLHVVRAERQRVRKGRFVSELWGGGEWNETWVATRTGWKLAEIRMPADVELTVRPADKARCARLSHAPGRATVWEWKDGR